MRYKKRNPDWPATISEFVPGETYMHTGQYEIEPVQFVRYTRYGAGSSWGDPSRVEVRDRNGRLWETTVTRLRLPREGEVRNPGRGKRNPNESGWLYSIIDPTPVKIRQTVDRLLTEYKAHWHLPDRYNYARSLAKLVDEYPWVGDQIPWDVLAIIRRDVKQRNVEKNPSESRHFSSRRLSEVMTQLRYIEKDAGEAEKIAIQSGSRVDFDKYNKQRIRAKELQRFLEAQIKRASPSGAWQATYEFREVPLGASHNQRVVAARRIQKQAGEAIARVLSEKFRRFS